MAITSQTGTFSFGPQSGKGVVATQFYKHRAADVDLAIVSDDRLGPPEVGGIPTPTIPYRAGVLATGGATINPRLENTFGWLLEGSLGDASVTASEDVMESTTTGTFYHHEFKFKSGDESFVPWMTMRKEIPAVAETTHHGETYIDSKIIGLTLALPNDGLINARTDILARMASGEQFTGDPVWSYANTQYEDYESIPIGCTTGGFIQIPDFSANDLPIAAATVTLTNAPLDLRQEKVYGSPFMEDITITGRALTVDMVVKWNDPYLYRSILTGSTTATQWTSKPFVSDLDVYALSPDVSPNSSSPYQLRVVAPAVMYQVMGGIRLAGNNAVMMRVQGTAIASTADYVVFHLGNEIANYNWPGADVSGPTVSSAEIGTHDDNTIVITFNEAVMSANYETGFSAKEGTNALTVVNGYLYDTSKIAIVLSEPVTGGQTIKVSYTSTTGVVTDLTGNDLATFTDHAVTNNT